MSERDEERWDRSRGARGFAAWTRFWAGHRVGLAVVLVVMGGIFSFLSRGVVWQADVLQFFSADSAEVRAVRKAAQEPGVATQLRLDVHGVGAGISVERLESAAEALAKELENSGEFRRVWTGVEDAELAASYGKLAEQGPVLLGDEDLAAVKGRVNEAYLQKRFAEVKGRLADPDGEVLLRQLAGDPLGVSQGVAGKLTGLAPGGSGGVTMENGMLVARDGAGGGHVMIVTSPKSLPSDQKGAEKTLAVVDGAIVKMRGEFPGTEVWVVGAHRGYVENAKRVMGDVTTVSMLGAVAVGVVIAIYFRRVWTALICLIPPGVGVGVALGVAGMGHVELPLLLLGFAGLLCGSTTDYGIQIIAEMRRLKVRGNGGGGRYGAIPARAAWGMLGPISMSVATSVTGFAALGLSESPGLRALGLFVAGATVCIWGVTFLVLPAYLGEWVLAADVVQKPPRHQDTKMKNELLGGMALVDGGDGVFGSDGLVGAWCGGGAV